MIIVQIDESLLFTDNDLLITYYNYVYHDPSPI